MTTEPKGSKPGLMTTEFWLVLFGAVAPVIIGAIPPEWSPALVVIYTICRTVVKAFEARK